MILPGQRTIYAITGASILAGITLSIAGFRYQPVTWRLHILGLTFAAASLTLYAPFVIAVLRGTGGRINREFAVVAVLTYVGFSLLFTGGFKTVNGMADSRPLESAEGIVTRKSAASLQVDVLVEVKDRRGIVSVRVRPDMFQRLAVHQKSVVLLHPGALAEPWVESLQLETQR